MTGLIRMGINLMVLLLIMAKIYSSEVQVFSERTVYILSSVIDFFLALSLITNNWGFFLLSLLPVFINVIFAFFTKKNKYIKRFNQSHSENIKPQ